MKEVFFNVIPNKPEQLVHLDFYEPERGFLVFATFTGNITDIDELKITEISFYVRQANITECIEENEEPNYIYPKISSSIQYFDENNPENDKEIKQIKFEFRPSECSDPNITTLSSVSGIVVKKGEPMDLKLEPVDFKGRKICKNGMANVNGHACKIKFYF